MGAHRLPRSKMWIELILDAWASILAMRGESFHLWFARSIGILFTEWVSGLVAYAFDGRIYSYVNNLIIYAILFGNGIIILYGVRGIRSFLEWLPGWARPIMRLNEAEFEKFFEGGERIACSILPPLVWVAVTAYLSPSSLLTTGMFSVHRAWDIAFYLYYNLLTGTGIWIIASLCILILRISRQPLDIQLSPQMAETFRPLALANLYGAVFVFLSLVIIQSFYMPKSIIEIAVYGFIIALCALAFLVPFYNIHIILAKLKRQELKRINEEMTELLRELEETLALKNTKNFRDRVAIINARLLALPLKEKMIRDTGEWPVKISFFTALTSLVGVTFLRFILDIVLRYFIH